MTDASLPEVGKTYHLKETGDVTVTGARKKGRGYYVLYALPDGEERRARLKDFQRRVWAA